MKKVRYIIAIFTVLWVIFYQTASYAVTVSYAFASVADTPDWNLFYYHRILQSQNCQGVAHGSSGEYSLQTDGPANDVCIILTFGPTTDNPKQYIMRFNNQCNATVQGLMPTYDYLLGGWNVYLYYPVVSKNTKFGLHLSNDAEPGYVILTITCSQS